MTGAGNDRCQGARRVRDGCRQANIAQRFRTEEHLAGGVLPEDL